MTTKLLITGIKALVPAKDFVFASAAPRPMKRPLWAAAALVLAFFAVTTTPLALAQPVGGTDVVFAAPDARSGQVQLRGKLWSTESASAVVILLHGSAGWTDHREGHYARAFTEAGLSVLAVDSFGPRGIATTTDDQSQVSALQMARDGFAASHYLRGQGFPIQRQALMGFSKGGAAVLFAADRTFLPQESERFAAALAFYPACSTRARTPKPASPIFMALGERDDYAGVQPCQEVASAFRASGGMATVNVYPDAAHTFDGDPAHTGMRQLRFVENYINCRLFVEEDGSMTLENRASCGRSDRHGRHALDLHAQGATVWTNVRQKMQATQDALAYLSTVFGKPPR